MTSCAEGGKGVREKVNILRGKGGGTYKGKSTKDNKTSKGRLHYGVFLHCVNFAKCQIRTKYIFERKILN